MEIKRSYVVIFMLFVSAMILPLVSAEIYFDRLDTQYNVGDKMDINMTLTQNRDTSDFLIANIICFDFYKTVDEVEIMNVTNSSEENSTISNETIENVATKQLGIAEIYRVPVTIKSGQSKDLNLEVGLDKFLIGNMAGECIIRTEYDEEIQDSPVFEITDNLGVDLRLSGLIFDPEERFNVVGNAQRVKGAPVEGFAEAKIDELNMSIIGVVKNGTFNFNFTIPRNAHAKEYELSVRVYEKDSNKLIINEGENVGRFRVSQINEEIKIAVSKSSVIPGELYDFNVLLYDQADDEVTTDVGVIVYYPDLVIFEERLVRTGASESIKISKNATPGYWKIKTSIDNLRTEKVFYVEELMDASFEMVNDTIVINNVGNVPYIKTLEVNLGDKTELVDVSVPANGQQIFVLRAPDGKYEVSLNEGGERKVMGSSFLTGNAISVKDVATLGSGNVAYVSIWVILILLLAAIAIYFYRNVRRKDYFGKTPKFKEEKSSSFLEKLFKKKSKGMPQGFEGKPALYRAPKKSFKNKFMNAVHHKKSMPGASVNPNSSEVTSGSVENGNKEKSSIACLKIKNMASLGGTSAIRSIEQALSKAKSVKSKIYIDGDYRIIIFSKSTSGEKDNNLRALKTARKVEEILNAHNKVYSPKIQFGIGVNSGELIVESREGKLKFTSLGNTIASAKRVSGESNNDVLISDKLHREVVGKVKTASDGTNWRLRKIVDRQDHSDFIRRFKDRQSNN